MTSIFRIAPRVLVLLPAFFVGFTSGVEAQLKRPTDMRSQLRLIESIDLSKQTAYQARFTEGNELFLSFRGDRGSWSYRKGSIQRAFLPCGGEEYRGGTLDHSGRILVAICPGLVIEVWNLNSGSKSVQFQQTVRNRDEDEHIFFQSISPVGRQIAFGFRKQSELAELWDIGATRKIAELTSDAADCDSCNRTVYATEFSPDGNVVAVAFGGMVFLWNAETGDLISRLIDANYRDGENFADGGTVRNILFSNDSKTVITGSGVGTAKSWDVRTGKLLQTFKRHKLAVTALALSADDRVLATGSRNQDVKLWDMATGKQLFSLNNRKEVRSISFRPDGERLMSMTSTHIFIWDSKTGSLLAEMPTPDIRLTSLSPNWKYFILPDEKKRTLILYEYQGD